MSETKFAFLPPSSAGATIHTYLSLTLCQIHLLSGVNTYSTLPLAATHQKGGLRATT